MGLDTALLLAFGTWVGFLVYPMLRHEWEHREDG